MLRERNRQIPAEALIYPLGQGEEINGASDVERVLADSKRVEAAQRLNAAAEQVTEKFLAATMQVRAAKAVEWAIAQLKPNDGAEQLDYLTNHLQGFGVNAAPFLERCDLGGFEHTLIAFHHAVIALPRFAPPKPPLMPHGDNVFPGWSSEEVLGLHNLLSKGLGGVTVGDRCISADADGATLASGKRVSKQAALEAYIPPAGGKQVSVGSLPQVLADIRRAQS